MENVKTDINVSSFYYIIFKLGDAKNAYVDIHVCSNMVPDLLPCAFFLPFFCADIEN